MRSATPSGAADRDRAIATWLVVAALVCAACGKRADAPERALPPPPVPSAPPTVPTPRVPVEAPPGPIDRLAITADGTAALTASTQSGTRLWPTLDGTREPCVVDLPPAKALAIARDGAQFLVATVDGQGTLSIADLDDHGVTRQRVVVPVKPRIVAVAALAHAVIAYRADGVILELDATGTTLGQVAVPTGARVLGIAAAGDRAVVALATGDAATAHARWLSLTGGLAWGEPIGGPEVSAAIAVSADGASLATILPTGSVAVIATASGALQPVTTAPLPADSTSAVIAASARVVAVHETELVVVNGADVRYLGYALQQPTIAAGPNGALVIHGAHDALVVGPDLRATQALASDVASGPAADTPPYPSPTGDDRLEVADRRIQLVGRDGAPRWGVPIGGVAGAVWLGDGSIAVAAAAAVFVLDGKTGAIRAARCGWRFELSATAHEPRANPPDPRCLRSH